MANNKIKIEDLVHGQAFEVMIRKPFKKALETVTLYCFEDDGMWSLKDKKHGKNHFSKGYPSSEFLATINSFNSIVKTEGLNYFYDNNPSIQEGDVKPMITIEVEPVKINSPVRTTSGTELKTPSYYDNSKGSLYKIAEQRGWGVRLFDVVKRLERGGKKDPLELEIDKTIALLQLWKREISG